MLDELASRMHKKYTNRDLETLERIEQTLSFPYFNSEVALKIGNLMIEKAKAYPEEIAIVIIREKDDLVIFQYVADSKAKRNIDFAMRKRLATLTTGHMSIWPLVHRVVTGKGELEENALPVGGAFPIKVNGKMVATIAVSGLHDGMDFQVIVDSLKEYLQVSIPDFNGPLI